MSGKLIAGRYQPLKQLGRRALGGAFLARDTQLDRNVILETLQGPPLKDEGAALPPDVPAALRADLERLLPLQTPGMLNLLDLQLDSRPPFMIFEPVEGESLVRWETRSGLRGAALEEALEEITTQLLDALAVLHRAGLVHKDIRPASVLRTARGDYVLLEPGVPRSPALEQVLHPGLLAQTTPFTAPEVLRGQAETRASDLYQLGALLRFVATGTPVWPSPEKAVIAAKSGERPPSMKQLCPHLREAWQIFLDELVAPDVGQRIATVEAAQEFQQMMQMEEAAQEAGVAPGAAPGPIAPPPADGGSWLPPLALALGVLVAGAGFWYTRPVEAPPVAMATEVVEGLTQLKVTWRGEGEAPVAGPLTLAIDGQEARQLTAEGGAFGVTLPWKDVAGKAYTLTDPSGNKVATDQLPAGYRELKLAVATDYGPEGQVFVVVKASRPVRVAGAYTRGDKPQEVKPGEAATEHRVELRPGFDEAIAGLKLRALGPLGTEVPVETPAEFPGHRAFFRDAVKALRELVPRPVKDALEAVVGQAKTQAVSIQVPGWDEVRSRWRTDETFRRLEAHGDLLFAARDTLDPQRIHFAYEDFQAIERCNTVIVAATPHEPLEVRHVYQAYVKVTNPDAVGGQPAIVPKGGSMMMQYDGAPASWLNEEGKKTWPSNFEVDFAMKNDWYQPGTRARFIIETEDVSSLYRFELRFTFPGAGPEGEDWERSYWFYPRRSMTDLATKKVEALGRIALEIPVAVIPDRIGKMRLEVDKLGGWGGHGGTTFRRLHIERVDGK